MAVTAVGEELAGEGRYRYSSHCHYCYLRLLVLSEVKLRAGTRPGLRAWVTGVVKGWVMSETILQRRQLMGQGGHNRRVRLGRTHMLPEIKVHIYVKSNSIFKYLQGGALKLALFL